MTMNLLAKTAVVTDTTETKLYSAGTSDDIIVSQTAKHDQNVINSGEGNDEIHADSANQNVISTYDGRDIVYGGDKGDTINAGQGDDIVFGGSGSDTIEGGSGDDRLYGGAGADFIFGDAGRDFIEGGRGDDTLSGGTDDDIFRYGLDQREAHARFGSSWGNDTITDFKLSVPTQQNRSKVTDNDKLDLSDFFARLSDKDVSMIKQMIMDVSTDNGNGTYTTIDDEGVSHTFHAASTNQYGKHVGAYTSDDLGYGGVFEGNVVSPIGAFDDSTNEKIYNLNNLDGDKYQVSVHADWNATTHSVSLTLAFKNLSVDDKGASIYLQNVGSLLEGDFVQETMKLVHGTDAANVMNFGSGDFVAALNGKGVVAYGFGGDDYIDGTAKADVLHGDDGNDSIDGHEGNDVITGDWGNDSIDGGAGNDNLWGGGNNNAFNQRGAGDYLQGGAGDDFLYAGSFDRTAMSAKDHDTLIGDWLHSADTENGARGNDVFVIGGKTVFTQDGTYVPSFKMDAGTVDIMDFTNLGYQDKVVNGVKTHVAIGEHDKIKFANFFSQTLNLDAARLQQKFADGWFEKMVHVNGNSVDISTDSDGVVHLYQKDNAAAQKLFDGMQSAVNSGHTSDYFIF